MKDEKIDDAARSRKTDNLNTTNRHHDNHIYVRAMAGKYQRLRRKMGWFFMTLFMMTPWISYGHRQAILIDINQQAFYFFGITLWPQDLTLLATFFIIAAFALCFITTFIGRVWCGYLCPQTVWTFIYIWFEEKLEGPANKRRKQNSMPLNASLFLRKSLKHGCWLSISLLTALTFVGYFVPIKTLFIQFFTASCGFWSAFWVLFFSACTYANAGWMRSIMCIHICPYARFQSAMFDKDTLSVSYHAKRGENRGPRSHKNPQKAADLGDCIDCKLCVQVCPTGIDIRDGLQYECINCGACVDACDNTMRKMNYPTKLISYTTEHQLNDHSVTIIRPKLIGYGAMMIMLMGVFLYLLSSVPSMSLSVLKDRNQLFKLNNEGLIENTYTLKVINKTQISETYSLSVSGIESIHWYGKQIITLQPGEIFTLPISLGVPPVLLNAPITHITFQLKQLSGKKLNTIEKESRFISAL